MHRRPVWHIFLHRRSEGERASPVLRPDGARTLVLESADLQQPFPCTFETLVAGLSSLPGAWCEPDGAFGWYPSADGSEELAGTIHCLDHRVMSVEMHMGLSPGHWQQVAALVRLHSPFIIQLAEQGVFVEEAEFDRLLDLETRGS